VSTLGGDPNSEIDSRTNCTNVTNVADMEQIGGADVGTGSVPTRTNGTNAVDAEWSSGTIQPLKVGELVPLVQLAIGNKEVLSSSFSHLGEDPPEMCTNGTNVTPDTASAIEADPVDNFDPMDLI
jgi:hypothetical protein